MHFAFSPDQVGEDAVTVACHADIAETAGISSTILQVQDIGVKGDYLYDKDDKPIDNLFMLYPWEWIVHEEFGRSLVNSKTRFLEPAWKMVSGSKTILTLMTHLFGDHKYLLWSSIRREDFNGRSFVSKPSFSREGQNVSIFNKDGQLVLGSDGDYSHYPTVYQDFFDLPNNQDSYPVFGSWCVDGFAAGIGIREDSLITGNTARFTPHVTL